MDNFEIKCKKCGSLNVWVSTDVLYEGELDQQTDIIFECNDCKNQEKQ